MTTIVRLTRVAAVVVGLVGCQAQGQLPTDEAGRQALYGNPNFCTKCHGGLDNGTGAPPFDLAGNSATVLKSIGAHSAHVQAGPMAQALGCSECHPDTENVCSPFHMNLQVDLQWGALAASHGVTPTYVAGSCANWCHGATMTGRSVASPSWTAVGQGQAACGACHGIPPTMPSPEHPVVQQGTKCRVCHPETMTIDVMNRDILIPGGLKHVNGVIEVQGHDAGWYVASSPVGGQHGSNLWNGYGDLTMNDYYESCTKCHGDGGYEFTITGGWTGVSCGRCHPAFFVTQQPVGDKCGGWTHVPCTSCIFCH